MFEDQAYVATSANVDEIIPALDQRYRESDLLYDALTPDEAEAVQTAYTEHAEYWEGLVTSGATTQARVLKALSERLLLSRNVLGPIVMNWAQTVTSQLKDSPHGSKAVFFMRDGNLAYTLVRFLIEHGYETGVSDDDLVPLYLSRNTLEDDDRVTRYIEKSLANTSDVGAAEEASPPQYITVDSGNNGTMTTLFSRYLPPGSTIHANYLMLSTRHGIPGAATSRAYLPEDSFELAVIESTFDPVVFEGQYPYPQKVGDYADDGTPVIEPNTDDYRTSVMKASEAGIRLYLQDIAEGRVRIAQDGANSSEIIERARASRTAIGTSALRSLRQLTHAA